MPPSDPISAKEWRIISQKRILFGHQSVGNNILSGVKTLASQAGVTIKLTESLSDESEPGIIHFKIGKNEDPRSKIKDFEDKLRNGAARGLDVAVMKFCYVDINGGIDSQSLAEDYISSLTTLSKQFPETEFIAVTVPLTTVQEGPKAWVKRLLRRELNGYAENFRRLEFNNILRKNLGRQGKLFDLAKYEAQGSKNYQYDGQMIEVLNPAMSSDGGHLNANGEQYVASKLLKYLAADQKNR